MQQWQPSAEITTLRRRALVMQQLRDWFQQQGILEVETPALSVAATTDLHIDSFTTPSALDIQSSAAPTDSDRHLRTSAEFHLKRLLAAGSGDIYELGKVFRVDECGRYHNPEFTMLEWYRCGINHLELVAEIEHLLGHLHGDDFPGLVRLGYRELWQRIADIDVADRNCSELVHFLVNHGCEVPVSIRNDFDTLLDLGMATVVTDGLPKDCYTCIYNYPASQAALARVDNTDTQWHFACRFEIYYGSVELANGYHELTDPDEQRRRFENDNAARLATAKKQMPVDDRLIAGLEHGMPDCAGVAIGVDRLLMILLPDINALEQVISFNWSRA